MSDGNTKQPGLYCTQCLRQIYDGSTDVCYSCFLDNLQWELRPKTIPADWGFRPVMTSEMRVVFKALLAQIGAATGGHTGDYIEEVAITVNEVRVRTTKGVISFKAKELDKHDAEQLSVHDE